MAHVQPALRWTEDPEHPSWGTSVEARLRIRAGLQPGHRPTASTPSKRPLTYQLMRAGDHVEEVTNAPAEIGTVSFSVAVFAFAPPDGAPARQLRRRRDYFDVRTGESWDVFFPGYFRYGSTDDPQQQVFDDHWGFSPRAFNHFRADLQERTQGRWRYSGGSDIVLMTAAVAGDGTVTIDYESVIGGPLTDSQDDNQTLTLAQVIEAISHDLESDAQSPSYGISRVTTPLEEAISRSLADSRRTVREAAATIAGEALGAIGARVLGLDR